MVKYVTPATINAESGSNGVRSDIDTWANARGQAVGKETTIFITQASKSGGSYQVGRGFFNFDIQGNIPLGSRITLVTLVHPKVSGLNDADSVSVYVVDHTASEPVVVADFNNIDLNGDTVYGSIPYSSLSTTLSRNLVLNSGATTIVQNALAAGTFAKFCIRNSLDVNNSTPSGVNEYTATPTDFQLVVDFIPPGGGFLFNLL